ncbi:MAG: Glycosyltransferase, partial [Berkelbacteria bacterium GW2011_GWA2_38_9]
MNKHEISFCFPAYNEEANIKQTILEAAKVGQGLFSDYEIVVTDDGSKDKTAQIVADLIKTNPKIKLIRQENKGYGGSVWTALTYA